MSFTAQHIDPSVPDLGDGPLPVGPYISSDYFALERDRIFGKVWLNVARGIEIPEPGNFVVKAVEVRNASVIIVRGKSGAIRAFHNVCSHRAAKVEWRTQGSARAFTCPYHAWTYDLEGELRNVPAECNFVGLNKADNGLTPIACEVWNDLVFINFDPQPTQSLSTDLDGFASYGDGFPFADLDATVTIDVQVVNCNWKIIMEAFQEVYHLNVLHKQTLGNVFNARDNPHGDPLYFRTFGPHRSLSIGFNPEHQVGPAEALSRRFASDVTSTTGDALIEASNELRERCPGLNPTRAANWAIDLNGIFPNTVWLASNGSAVIHRFWPLDVYRTRYEAHSYYPKPKKASERFARGLGFGLFRDTIVEDILNTEFSQQALLSGAKRHVHLQRGEIGIRHHLHTINRYVQGEGARG